MEAILTQQERAIAQQWAVKVQELEAEIERLKAAIAYVRQRSQQACEILNEFDNTPEPKP